MPFLFLEYNITQISSSVLHIGILYFANICHYSTNYRLPYYCNFSPNTITKFISAVRFCKYPHNQKSEAFRSGCAQTM